MPATVTFVSKYKEHQIVMLHDTKMLVNGNQIFKTPHRTLQFANFRLTTSDPEIIAFLKAHPAYGYDFMASDDAAKTVAEVQGPKPGQKLTEPEAPPTVTRKRRVAAKPTTASDRLDDDV